MSTPALLLWLIGLATLLGVAGGLVIALCRIAGESIANALGAALKLRARHDAADQQADRDSIHGAGGTG